MAELDNIPQPARQHLERIGGADLVIGLLAGRTDGEIGAAVALVREALAKLSSSVRTVVTYSDPAMEQTAAEWGCRRRRREPAPALLPSGCSGNSGPNGSEHRRRVSRQCSRLVRSLAHEHAE